MTNAFTAKPPRMGRTALALATLLAIGGIVGCGGDGKRGDVGAITAKADAVQVTYYYLPG